MLDGRREIGESLCFGVKTLRSTIYFRTLTRVDYENWWKEFSSFVAAPIIKRTQSKIFFVVFSIVFGGFLRQKQHTTGSACFVC